MNEPSQGIKCPKQRTHVLVSSNVMNYVETIDAVDCDIFLEKLRNCGCAFRAAKFININLQCFEEHRQKNKDFSDAWDWAIKESADILELEARRRAVDGVVKTIWHKDKIIGDVVEYSDKLLALLLKAEHPGLQARVEAVEDGGSHGVININRVY